MDIEGYLEKYPKAQKGSFASPSIKRPGDIREGVIQFTEESAYNWAGPYPGGYAKFYLANQNKAQGQRDVPTVEEAKAFLLTRLDKEIKNLERGFSKRDLKNKRKARKLIPNLDDHLLHSYIEGRTKGYPFKLYFHGNDDTSYTCYFQTQKEAEELIGLLEGTSPVDFKEFLDFGFFFTN